jgi:hypothetical protein
MYIHEQQIKARMRTRHVAACGLEAESHGSLPACDMRVDIYQHILSDVKNVCYLFELLKSPK